MVKMKRFFLINLLPDLDTVTTNARRCKGDFTRDTVCIVFSRTTFGSECKLLYS